jgi:choline/carnitine/betaine transport
MSTTETPRERTDSGDPGVPRAGTEPAEKVSTDQVILGTVAVIAVGLVLWGSFGTESLSTAVTAAFNWVLEDFGWLFVLAATGFVLFSFWLAFSKYGRIPLGEDGEKPEFRTISWIAMMFSAGMGIGLMFFGVVEPLSHFNAPPPGSEGVDPASAAMATTLFHWTLHPWAMYAVVGLAIAYSTYRRGRRQLISSAFAPLIGERRANSGGGRAIDILALFATLFGSAASLGLGALQIGAGLNEVGGIEAGDVVLVLIIVVLTIAFVASAVSGVAKGIQWLSNTNMVLAIVLAFFVFVVGPTILILNLIPTAIGTYISELPSMSALTAANSPEAATWLAGWTIFYWAWWVSWTPFVGMFIARISRGRTIRQFVIGVIAVPSTVSLVWFAIFGGAAIDQQSNGVDLTQGGEASTESQLFGLLEQFPLAGVMSVLVMILVAIFFVSGADAASMVMGTLSQRGTQHPTRTVVIFWGVLMGAVAAVMLLLGGATALTGLQTLTIIAAFPFALVMIALCVSLALDLKSDPMMQGPRDSVLQRTHEAIVDTERARERGRGEARR